MNRTPIEWTHWSVNAFKMRMPDGTLINVCIHKSEGCRNCYAEMIVRRWWKKEWGEFPGYTAALLKLGTPVLVEAELQAVLRLNERIAKGKADPTANRLFWHDMTDEYLDFWPDEFLDQVWAVRALTPNLVHQVLTKRIERALTYFRGHQNGRSRFVDICHALSRYGHEIAPVEFRKSWPLPNVHFGVSVEDQKTADERIPLLLQTPAAVRWISAEPLLGPIEFSDVTNRSDAVRRLGKGSLDGIHWIVCGGESGPKARPMHPDWARSLRDQCVATDVPFFFKQWGEWSPFATEAHYAADSTMPGSAEVIGGDCGGVHGYGAPFKYKDDRVFANLSGHEEKLKMVEVIDRPDHTWGKENKLQMTYLRLGKKAAGRLLDGREWNEYPKAQAVSA